MRKAYHASKYDLTLKARYIYAGDLHKGVAFRYYLLRRYTHRVSTTRLCNVRLRILHCVTQSCLPAEGKSISCVLQYE